MTWQGIRGHDDVVEQFRRALERGRLASSFLFSGPAGIGKRSFALELARSLLCQTRAEEALDPCGKCAACVQVSAGTHPDLLEVAKPDDRAFIPLELLIGDKDHRMREGLCHDISLRPFMGGRKVAIVDDADHFNLEGANCLLKTLEEPPPGSVLILIGTSPAKQLPTIRSRCQLVRFRPLATEVVAELLVSKQLIDDPAEARLLAEQSEGSLQRALELADAELRSFRETLLKGLADRPPDSVRLARAVSAFVDEVRSSAAARRQRIRQLIGFAAQFYRLLIHGLNGSPLPEDGPLVQSVRHALQRWPHDELVAADCLERCLEGVEQLDRNANQTTLIECWLDDLAKLAG